MEFYSNLLYNNFSIIARRTPIKMKKGIRNTSGFVLVETLVVAVAVAAIFSLLFKHFYPLMGEYEVRENYDDIDSKYGTFWIKKIIENPSYQLDKNTIKDKSFVMFSCSNINEKNKVLREECDQLIESLEVSCDNIETSDKIERCVGENKPHIYITKYQLSYKLSETGENVGFKQYVQEHPNTFTSSFMDYINYLPSYKKASSEEMQNNHYRVIIEYYRHRFDTEYYKKKDDSGNYITENVVNEKDENTTNYQLDKNFYEVDKNDFLSYSTIGVMK